MNKKRNQYIYELVGIIQAKKLSKLKGRDCYKLMVAIVNQPQISSLQAFRDKLTTPDDIWLTLSESKCFGKQYLFHCQNYFGNYHLINWKELSHGK